MGGGARAAAATLRQAQPIIPSEPAKPKADDKAYNSALKSFPDKQYDPWHGIH